MSSIVDNCLNNTTRFQANQKHDIAHDVTYISVALSLPLILIDVFGIVGNCLICHVTFRDRTLRSPSNVFVVNLAVSDLMVCIICIPYSIAVTLYGGDPLIGEIYCSVLGFFTHVLSGVSMLTLCAFSVYRFYAVKTIIPSQKLPNIIGSVIFSIWFISVAVSIPPIFGWGNVAFDNLRGLCSVDWAYSRSYTITNFALLFALPSSIMVVAYGRIFRFLRRRRISDVYDRGFNYEKGLENTDAGHNSKRRQRSADNSRKGKRSQRKVGISSDSPPVISHGDSLRQVVIMAKLQSTEQNMNSKKDAEACTNIQPESLSCTELNEQKASVSFQNELSESQTSTRTLAPQNSLEENTNPIRKKSSIYINIFQKSSDNITPLSRENRFATSIKKHRRRLTMHESKLVKILFMTVIAFVISYAPYAVDTLICGVTSNKERTKTVGLVEVYLMFFSSCCNPVIYAVLNAQYRKALRDVFSPCIKASRDP